MRHAREPAVQPIDPDELRALLAAAGWAAPVTYLPRTGSTNDDALAALRAGAAHGTTVVAERQTAGRGRRGRRWLSPPGSLLFSMAIRACELPFWPAVAASVGVARAVHAASGVALEIKWPNDLMGGGRKAGGILVETQGDAAVVGIGLNVNAAAGVAGGTPTVAIAELAGHFVDRTRLLAMLLPAVLGAIDARGDERRAVRDAWEQWSSVRGRRVQVSTDQAQHAGVVEGFGTDGELRLRRDDGLLLTLAAGDITLRADTEPGALG